MIARLSTRSPEGRRHFHVVSVRAARLAALLSLPALVAACGAVPSAPFAGPHPSDVNAPVPRATYRTVVGPYTSQRPSDPSAWREQNERVAPESKP
jgi:hypothetical protein